MSWFEYDYFCCETYTIAFDILYLLGIWTQPNNTRNTNSIFEYSGTRARMWVTKFVPVLDWPCFLVSPAGRILLNSYSGFYELGPAVGAWVLRNGVRKKTMVSSCVQTVQ